MKRLGNRQVTKSEGTRALINLMGGPTNIIKLNLLGTNKLGVSPGDRVDVLEGDIKGEFFIAKTQVEGEGRKLDGTKGNTFTSSSIYASLSPFGKVFEITDSSIDFDGLTWYKLISTNVATTEPETTKVVKVRTEKPKAEVKPEVTVAAAPVEKDNF